MSLRFFGWEVIYDDEELGASQTPRDRGIYTMYHGTSVASARLIIAGGFRQSTKGMLGKGVYVSRDPAKAHRYPMNGNDSDRVVLKLRVRVGRVKRIDRDNHPLQLTWSSEGYDTAWVPAKCGMKAVPSGLEEDCVFDPKNIRVVAIEKAPDAVLLELQQLVANNHPFSGNDGGASARTTCPCMRFLQGPAHVTQECWGCQQNICPYMPKHVCRGSF